MTWKIIKWSLIIVLGLILVFVADTIYDSGFFKQIDNHFEGNFRKVLLEPGAEDIVIDQASGIAFISCDDRRKNESAETNVKGAIYAINLKDQKSKAINLTKSFQQDFHPHGIDLYRNEEGNLLIFAVNHRQNYQQHSVEIFEYRGDYLQHLESISDSSLMTSPNDLVAVGERQFYVSNDHGDVTEFNRMLEDYLRLPYAYVNYYDGTAFFQVARGINYANGINILPQKNLLVVASTTARKLLMYEIPKDKRQDLKHVGDIFMDFGVDNISLDAANNLWVAGHPKLLSFVAHKRDKRNFSPSQVVKVRVVDSQTYHKTEVLMNSGEDLSGASVAALYQDQLLIGSVYEPHILWATLKKEAD